MPADVAELRKLLTPRELLQKSELERVLDSGEFQLKVNRDSQQTCKQYQAIYETRHAIAVHKGLTSEIVPQMRELCDGLKNSPDSICLLWIVDTGDLEFVAFEIVDQESMAGILSFDRNKLPGRRICKSCQSSFHGKPPDYLCGECGSGSVPDTWKYRPND